MKFIVLPFLFIISSFCIAQKKPNIIILFTDDMGYGDLSCYGHPNIKTPHIDNLATEGIRLTSFYSAGAVCVPSRAGLMTGCYPVRVLEGNTGPGSKGGLKAGVPTIAEVLKNVGYKSMAVGKWHLGYIPKEQLPTNKGFDKFYGLPYSNDMIRPWVNTDIPLMLYVDDAPVKNINYDQERLTIDCTEESIRFIHENTNQPFFLYLAYSMPHLPISTTQEFLNKSKGGLYGDVIETIDWSVGEIVKALNDLQILDNTLIIFASDNGPWNNLPARMLQKGVKPWHQGTAGLLRGSKGMTYEGGMRVPGIIYWEGQIPAGQVSSDIASTLDILPTIVDITKADIPSDVQFDGKNLFPFLKGISPSPRREFLYFLNNNLEAIRKDEWKLRLSNKARPEKAIDDPLTPELYDLKNDPGENYNVAEDYPEIVNQLSEEMKTRKLEYK